VLSAPLCQLIFTDITGQRKTVAEHFDELKHQIDLALAHQPFQINCHSGMDSWSYAQSLEFFTLATAYTKTLTIPVYHETHRGRALYNPWVTRDLVQALPDLMLTADYSHWSAALHTRARLRDVDRNTTTGEFH
jgi:hypothetical protein